MYHRPKGESAQNLALMRRIDKLFLECPFYGSRQMVRHLCREGLSVGRHRVRRLMRLMGLEAIYRAPRTTRPHPEHRVYPYLLKGLTIERPNHAWTADITYIPVQKGFLKGLPRMPLLLFSCAPGKEDRWQPRFDLPSPRKGGYPGAHGIICPSPLSRSRNQAWSDGG